MKFSFNEWKAIGLIVLIGILLDYFLTHGVVFNNNPAFLQYFVIVKAVPALIIIWLFHEGFKKRFGGSTAWTLGVPLGIIVFVSFVSLIYGYYPIPMADGSSVAITMEESFTQGFPHHFLDFMIAYVVVSFLRWRRVV